MRWRAAYPLALLLAARIEAQQVPRSPDAAVAAAFAAEDEGDIHTLVSLVHPDAMAAFKRHQLQLDSLLTPLEQSAGARRGVSPHPSLLQLLFNVCSRAEFERLSPEDVVTRWFVHSVPARETGDSIPAGTPVRRRHILGDVPEGPSVVHVVVREEWVPDSEPGMRQPREPRLLVLTTEQVSEGWKVMLNGGLAPNADDGWAMSWSGDDKDLLKRCRQPNRGD